MQAHVRFIPARNMNVESIRRFCLSFPHATEKLQWEDALCFKVGGKLFAILNLSSVPPNLVFKCTPQTFAELAEREGIVPAAYVGRYNWVSVAREQALSWPELQDLVRESYAMVAAKARTGRAAKKKFRKTGGAGKRA
jgi:predicted DNA-binding protein (MmcQ/YjbR family)